MLQRSKGKRKQNLRSLQKIHWNLYPVFPGQYFQTDFRSLNKLYLFVFTGQN